MSYVKPKDVESPKSRWILHRVLRDGGDGGWSAAEGQWKDDDGVWRYRLALRWNGGSEAKKIGNPQSRGNPTWFLVPHELEEAIREKIKEIHQRSGKSSP